MIEFLLFKLSAFKFMVCDLTMAFLSLFPLFSISLAFIFILSLDIKSALFIRSPFRFIDIS